MSDVKTAMKCTSCGRIEEQGLVHTWLMCELYKRGWTRTRIVANVLFTADALRERNPDV